MGDALSNRDTSHSLAQRNDRRMYSVWHNRIAKHQLTYDFPDDRRWFWIVWGTDADGDFWDQKHLPVATGFERTEVEARQQAKRIAGRNSRRVSNTFAEGFLMELCRERFFQLHPERRPERQQQGPSLSNPAFAVLGLVPPFTSEDVKTAYRRKVKEAHPDAGGDTGAFVEVESAYRIALVYCQRYTR